MRISLGSILLRKGIIMKENFTIQEVLNLIKESTCLDLKPCEYFTGIRETAGRKYFNVMLNQSLSDSLDYQILLRFANKYKLIDVSPNGLKRVAIFPRVNN